MKLQNKLLRHFISAGVVVLTSSFLVYELVASHRDMSEYMRYIVEKGESAFRHHEDFHTRIVDAIHASLTEEECRILIKGLSSFEKNLKDI